MVDVLVEIDSGVVLDRSTVKFCRSSSSTRRKGRYLLPVCGDEGGLRLSLILVLDDPLGLSRFDEEESS